MNARFRLASVGLLLAGVFALAGCQTAPTVDAKPAPAREEEAPKPAPKAAAKPAPVDKTPVEKPPAVTHEKPVAPVPEKTVAPVEKPVDKPAPLADKRGEAELKAGLLAYDTGDHKVARKRLQAAVEIGLDAREDQVKAWKHLAFLACANRENDACLDAFRKVLTLQPGFKLSPSEAGHPLWQPAYRQVKAEMATRARAAAAKGKKKE